MTPDQYCENQAAPAGSDLYYSFLYLAPETRRAVTAVHAFCQQLSGVVNDRGDDQVARSKLDWWVGELERCYAGTPQHPVTRALQEPLERYNLPREYFAEILDGAWMDMDRRRYASFNELALYCYRVSGVVGLMSAEIFGYAHRDTLRFATELGTAFRLTGVVLNLRDDLRQGRVYLPLDELDEIGIAPDELPALTGTDRLLPLARRQLDRARRQFETALQHLPETERAAQTALLIRAAIDQALLDEVEADGLRVARHHLVLSPLRKFWIAWSTNRREQRRARH